MDLPYLLYYQIFLSPSVIILCSSVFHVLLLNFVKILADFMAGDSLPFSHNFSCITITSRVISTLD